MEFVVPEVASAKVVSVSLLHL